MLRARRNEIDAILGCRRWLRKSACPPSCFAPKALGRSSEKIGGRKRYASRNVGRVLTVSHLALIGLRPPVGSLHQ
jgi:hypothetical protein